MNNNDNDVPSGTESNKSRGRPIGSKNNKSDELESVKNMLKEIMCEIKETNERISALENRTTEQQIQSSCSIGKSFIEPNRRLVKLPKHELPKFDGNLVEWEKFWQHFCHLIGSCSDISPIDKLIYLKECIKDQPYNMVKHLPLSESSYDIAVDILCTEYGDNKNIVKILYKRLLDIKVCDGSLRELRRFLDDLAQIVLQLSAITNIDITSIIAVVESKLPYWVREKIVELQTVKYDIQVTDILSCLRSIIRIKEEAGYGNVKNVEPNNFNHSNFSKTRPSLTFFNNTKEGYRQCIFCKEMHKSGNCLKFNTLVSRENCLSSLHRCIKCTRLGHSSSHCIVKLNCFFCSENHHTWLCSQKLLNQVNENNHVVQVSVSLLKSPVLLKCVKCQVYNPKVPNQFVEALILLDDGSTTSYVTKELAKKLGLSKLSTEQLKFNTFNDNGCRVTSSDIVQLAFKTKVGKFEILAHTISHIAKDVPHYLVNNDEHILKVVDSYTYGMPDILIGSDFYYEFNIRPSSRLSSGFSLLESVFGYIIAGRGNVSSSNINTCVTLHSVQNSYKELEKNAANYFSLESIGITEELESKFSLEEYQRLIKFKNERYEAPLPWKSFPPDIPSNYGLCLGRLRSTLKHLSSQPELLRKYHKIITDQLNEDVIEVVDKSIVKENISYIPHQAVINESKGKVRVVYDASAKYNKYANSINDCLHAGPLLLRNLLGILIRFRMYDVVVFSDIEKAFLQVSLLPEHRNFTRFLWVSNPELPLDERNNLITYRFCRIAFGITSSPFILASTILKHCKENSSTVLNETLLNLYVDNIMLGSIDSSEANKKSVNLKAEFKKIGMNLREFISNDKEAINSIAECDKLTSVEIKILGILWDCKKDCINFKVNPPKQDQVISMQTVLSYIASIFDPLGLLSPAILQFKVFFQSLWEENYKWTDQVNNKHNLEWYKLSQNVKKETISFPRMVFLSSLKGRKFELHAFSDASSLSFACVVYVKVIVDSIKISSSIIFSKSKVCPKRYKGKISIHRLELLGLLIASKAIFTCFNELSQDIRIKENLSEILNVWTDSSTVLHWLRSEVKQERFVENRLKDISKVNNLVCRYVNTAENPADLATRGCSFSELNDNKLWKNGPNWLNSSKNYPEFKEIPIFNVNLHKYRSTDQEIVLSSICVSFNFVIDFNRFSSWKKLLNTTCFILKFIQRCSKQKMFKDFPHSEENKHTTLQYNYAQHLLFKLSQLAIPPSNDERRDLKLYEDEKGLLRANNGRIDNSLLDFSSKYPIFFPKKSRVTELFVYHTHIIYCHAGPVSVLNHIRKFGWITQGRRTVGSIIRKLCLNCKKLAVSPFCLPQMQPLPAERVRQSAVFAHIGIDLFGPIYTKEKKKVWVVLFTCFSIRAIHLETCESLSTESFLESFRRFVARRGKPKSILSDNGRNFVLAKKVIDIPWNFIVERAPWKGGLYERMIGIVKQHMKRTISKSSLTLNQLQTVLTEIEFVINCRPLTFVSDRMDNPQPLRPIDFLSPMVDTDLLNLSHNTKQLLSNHETVVNSYENLENKVEVFWEKWKDDYLLALRERKFLLEGKVSIAPQVNEVVLVYDENAPRNYWKLAVIEKVESTSAKIRFASGRKSRRSWKHLYPLELTNN